MPISLKSTVGGGTPVNSIVQLFSLDNIVTDTTGTYLRTGYIDSNVGSYPEATKLSWLYSAIPQSSVAFTSTNQLSDMVYFSSRWIIVGSTIDSNGQVSAMSTADFSTSPTSSGVASGLTVELTTKPVLLVDGSSLHCYVGKSTNRYTTTNGLSWTPTAISGFTGHIIDVKRTGSYWTMLTTDGLYSSTNGTSWTLRQSWSFGGSISQYIDYGKLAVNGSTTVAVMRDKTNYYTTTDGTTFTSTDFQTGYVSLGYIAYGNVSYLTHLKNNITSNNVNARSTDATTWVYGQGVGHPARYHTDLNVWLGLGGGNYSKNGLDFITVASSVNTLLSWVNTGGKTYGLYQASNYFFASASHTPECVGIPYNLQNVSVGQNLYIKVA